MRDLSLLEPSHSNEYPALPEQSPLAIISKAVALPQGYYRSKLFTAPYSANPLIAAAAPILSLLERLCLSTALPPIDSIRANIEHELCAFRSQLDTFPYLTELKNTAYYLLCSSIDELLGKNYLRIYQLAPEFKSFTPVTPDGLAPDQRFFEILHYVKERPNQYLDLIELIYFCLIAGFEGMHHLKADGRQVLDNIIEDLYQLIQQYRCNKVHRLFHDHQLPKMVKTSYKTTLWSLAFAVGLLGLAFISTKLLLENKAKTILLTHPQLAILTHHG